MDTNLNSKRLELQTRLPNLEHTIIKFENHSSQLSMSLVSLGKSNTRKSHRSNYQLLGVKNKGRVR